MQLRPNRITLSFLLTALSLLAPDAQSGSPICRDIFPPAATVSERLAWLEHDSPERLKWVRDWNGKFNASLKSSANKRPIEDWLWNLLDKPRTSKRVQVADGSELALIDQGLGKATELVLKRGESSETLFSNLQLKRNNSFGLIDFSLSLSKKYVVMAFLKEGSIDDYRLVVYDLASRSVLRDDVMSISSTLGWATESRFMVNFESQPGVRGYLSYDIPSGITRTSNRHIYDVKEDWILINGASVPEIFRYGVGSVVLKGVNPLELVGTSPTHIYFLAEGREGLGEIRRVKRTPSTEPSAGEIVQAEGKMLLTEAKVHSKTLFAHYRMGADRRLQVMNLNGVKKAEIQIPDCCSYVAADWEIPGRKLKVTLTSAVTGSKKFIYDVKTRRWEIDEMSLRQQMLTTDTIEFNTEVIEVRSQDGVDVPVRLTYRKDLVRNGKNPALIESYGGFDRSVFFDPEFDAMNLEFIKRGGIHVGPALRGGNEFGPRWHKAAMFDQKINTMNDLIATARYLSTSQWSQLDLIVSMGTSDGGYTVASAALLAPDAFGLVIPINGVHDQLKKETLDPRFGPGWAYEYGDARDPKVAAYLTSLASVELAPTAPSKPAFFVVNGRNDSRVNPVHSFKLAEGLSEGNADVKMTSVQNAGHWGSSAVYQDIIGWRFNVVIWTTIFDHIGWQF